MPTRTCLPGPTSRALESKPVQVWEGTVLAVHADQSAFEASLKADRGDILDLTATLSARRIPREDRARLRPGAVFYLAQFKRWDESTVEYTHDIRFGRKSKWSAGEVREVWACGVGTDSAL